MNLIKLYLENLTVYDKVALIWLVLTFLILLIFGLYFLRKKPIFSLFCIIFSFIFLGFGFFGVKYLIDVTIRKNIVTIAKIKPLHFSNSVIIEGSIENLGKINFKECIVNLKITRHSSNRIKNFINLLKPIRNESIFINRLIPKNQSYKFKTIVNNIIYKKDYNTTAHAICY